MIIWSRFLLSSAIYSSPKIEGFGGSDFKIAWLPFDKALV